MPKHSNHTRSIIIIGFLLIASFAIIGIILIYGELIKFSQSSDTTDERKELVVIGNTLVSLYKLEGSTSQLAAKNVAKIKEDYDSLMYDVSNHIDTLKKISPEPEMDAHLDSVVVLLDLKKKNVWGMLQLLDSVEKRTVIETSTKNSILSTKDLDYLNKVLKKTTQSVEDTAVIKTKKKRFFQRVKDVFNNQVPDSSIQVSKNQTESLDTVVVPTLTDTITEFIGEKIITNDKRNEAILHKLVSRQHLLNRTNERITTQINQIMRDIESREFQTSLNLLRDKDVTLRRSSRIVAAIGLLALTSTLLFLFLALRSLTRSQRYRRELEQSLKQIKNLSTARERLMLTITHDIKAPLSSIIGFIELLYKSKLPEKEKYYLENMQNSSEHVLQLVKNLLDYHTLESDEQAIKLMPFYPHSLLKDIYQSFIPLANKEKLAFQFNHDEKQEDKDASYLSDPYRIRQIVSNILSNAIKFTPHGGSVVFSFSISNLSNQRWLILSVKDSGPGVSEEEKKVIFEEFRRLKNSKYNSVEGSGLGLAITEKLVHLLKGTISINSSVGQGAEFIVKIPLEKAGNNFSLPTKSKAEKVVINVSPDKKILFIDDDFVQLNLVFELLKREGLTPSICGNSLDALALLQRDCFDIVFTDIQMPDMNGFELVERIRMATFKGCSTMPIIALSGSSDMPEIEYIESGFSGFLPKPYTSEQILNTIQKFLGEDSKKPITETLVKKGFVALSDFAGDDTKAGSEIIQSFIDESKHNVLFLKNAFEKNDQESIKSICHKMLPLMRMITANEVVDILSDFEKGNILKEKEVELILLIQNQIKDAESFLSDFNK